MILSNEGRSGEIAEVEGFDGGRMNICVGEGVPDRLCCERTKITIGEGAKGGFPDANNGNRSHIL